VSTASGLLWLFWSMLRYRVALMIWMFMLLGVAYHRALQSAGWRVGWAAVSLGCAYVAATTANDVADRDIDRINHPGDPGRPLVRGTATERDLLRLHVLAALAAVLSAVPLGQGAVTVVAISVLIGQAYSLGPVRLSYRTYLAPAALAVAYVVLPYGMGIEVAGSSWRAFDIPFVTALALLFGARINLKDFRDREGDAAFGKPTLLLRFGKTATCAASLGLLVAGNVVLAAALRPPGPFLALIEVFFVAMASRLHALWVATDPRSEQVAIGLGAKLGNGLLIMVLGWLALSAHGAAMAERLLFAGSVTAVFGLVAAMLAARPERAVIGYKG
jgi:4-hydroxybenzoate polyprenyltransferase